jgi:predicted phosphate transport protein (TIGR00153 family)
VARANGAIGGHEFFTTRTGLGATVLGLKLRTVPKDRQLLDLLGAAAANVSRAAGLLDQVMKGWPDRRELVREILICEQEGDRITHDVIHLLNTSKVTAIDRGDILALASALDDVVDYAEEAADFLGLYKIEAPMEQAEQLTGVLRDAARNLDHALAALSHGDPLAEHVREVNRLENEGDRISRDALASLFERGIDPMVVIRWKDIVERIEQAIDACEHSANIAEGILVKNA